MKSRCATGNSRQGRLCPRSRRGQRPRDERYKQRSRGQDHAYMRDSGEALEMNCSGIWRAAMTMLLEFQKWQYERGGNGASRREETLELQLTCTEFALLEIPIVLPSRVLSCTIH